MDILDFLLKYAELFFKLLIPIILLIVGYFYGNKEQKQHYENILKREKLLKHIVIVPSKRPPADFTEPHLVKGNVVISSNYFTRLLAWFSNFMGGQVNSYEVLLDRARREAILRLKEEAARKGSNIVFCFRFETSTLNDIHNPQEAQKGIVEVLAYGTAGKIKQ